MLSYLTVASKLTDISGTARTIASGLPFESACPINSEGFSILSEKLWTTGSSQPPIFFALPLESVAKEKKVVPYDELTVEPLD